MAATPEGAGTYTVTARGYQTDAASYLPGTSDAFRPDTTAASADYPAAAGLNSFDYLAFRPDVEPAEPAPTPTPTPNPGRNDRDDDDDDSMPPVVIPDGGTPTAETPAVDIPAEEVPLAEIPEEEIPLAEVPETGDAALLWAALAAASLMGLAAMTLAEKRKIG